MARVDVVRGRTGARLFSSADLLLWTYAALSLAAAIPLLFDSARTDRSFAWTIEPPITAAFLGACYASSFVLYAIAARERRHDQLRVILPAGFVFTSLMLLATLLHLDRFHLDNGDTIARVVAWSWLAVYISVPVVTLAFLVWRWRWLAWSEPARLPLAGPIRGALLSGGAALVALGAAFVIAPSWTDAVWPWALTPLTGRALGVWLVAIGLIGAHAAWERALGRIRPILVSYAALPVLQAIVLARYLGELDWSGLRAWVYVAALAAVLAIGAAGTLAAARPSGT